MAQIFAITNPNASGPITLNESGVITVFQQGIGYALTDNQRQMLMAMGCALQDDDQAGTPATAEVISVLTVRDTLRALIRALVEQQTLTPTPELLQEYLNATNTVN